MLVLSRKAKQQIKIGDDVVITILQVRGQTVRVGIEAPRQTRVVRGEIAHLAHDEGEQASLSTGAADRPAGGAVARRLVSEALLHASRTTADYRASSRTTDAGRSPSSRLSPTIKPASLAKPASSAAQSPPCEASSW